jgi:hypothetical protein
MARDPDIPAPSPDVISGNPDVARRRGSDYHHDADDFRWGYLYNYLRGVNRSTKPEQDKE